MCDKLRQNSSDDYGADQLLPDVRKAALSGSRRKEDI